MVDDTAVLYASLPQFVQDSDAALGLPFQAWLSGPGQILQNTDTLVRDVAAGPGWSLVLDVTRCPTNMLPWLAQFVGVRFGANQTTDAEQRNAIVAEQGFGRGTPAQILGAANYYLTSGSCTLIERTPDPGSIVVEVPSASLNAGTWAELAVEYPTWTAVLVAFSSWAALTEQATDIITAILNAVPAGIFVTIVLV